MARQADASEVFAERIDDACDGIAQLCKAIDNRFTLADPRFLDRYCRREVCITCRYLLKSLTESEPQDFYAVFIGPNVPIWRIGDDFDVLRLQSFVRINTNGISQDNDIGNNQQKLMFVSDIEFMKNGQRVPLRGHCMAWLESSKVIPNPYIQSLYLRCAETRFELIDGPANRKIGVLFGGVPVRNERPHQMIETGSKLIEDLTCDNSEWERRSRWSSRGESIFTAISVFITRRTVLVRLTKPLDFDVEVADVMIGPLNLFTAPIKWM